MKHGSFLGLLVCASLALLSLATSALAQIPVAQLGSVFPPGGKQGTTVEVTIAGTDLDDVDKLVFGHAGITAAPKMTTPTELEKTPKAMAGQFTVQIAADVPPGVYEVAAVGRFGMSNVRWFAVGNLNEVMETPGNNSPEKAVALAIGSTVNGRVEASNYDFLSLTLKQGERVLLNCAGQRLDSRIDPTLVLINPAGREVARVRDTVGQDPVLDYTAPVAGTYLVKLYDAIYGGGPDYFYRLTASAAPYVDFVFPPSGPAGSSNQYTVYGRNLPGGQPADGLTIDGAPLQKVQVSIPLPADEAAKTQLALGMFAPTRRAWQDGIEFRLPTPQGPSNPVTVYFSKAAPVAEQEPNTLPTEAQKITVPCEYVGQFYPQSDVDWVQFDAKKGQIYWVEAISHQLGLKSDPYFAIFRISKDDKGVEQSRDIAQVDDLPERNQKIGGDFDATSDDPSYKFTVPEDGTYRIMIRDQFGDGRKDPSYVYRLAIREAAPDFRLLAYADPPAGGQRNQNETRLAAASVRKGGTVAIELLANRMDDFKGEIAISVEGLPAGVTCSGAVIGGEVTSASLVVVAAENAAAWAGPVKIVGKAKVGDKELVREARYAVVVWGTQNRQQQAAEFRLSRTLQLGVIDREAEPALVQVGEDKVWETSLGGSVEIPVKLTRRGEFKDAVKLTAAGLPNEIKPKEVNLAAGAADAKFELQLTQQNIKPGSYTFYLRGDAKRKYIRNAEAIPAAEAEQKQLVEMIKTLTDGVKAATTAKDQATKAAQEAAAAAKQAEAKKTEAAAAMKAKADAAKVAADKLKAAQEAAAKDAANQALADAAKAAETVSTEAAAQAKKAEEGLAAADKALTEAQTKSKTLEEARVAAEAALKASADKVAAANQLKTQVDKRVADAKRDNQPKDLNFALISTPIKVRINPSPFMLTVPTPAATVKQNEKTPVSVNVSRLYGFADQVELTLEPPKDVQGLSAAKVDVAKDAAEGKLEVAAAANATAGQHKCVVRARGKFNNVQVESTSEVTVTVEAAPKK